MIDYFELTSPKLSVEILQKSVEYFALGLKEKAKELSGLDLNVNLEEPLPEPLLLSGCREVLHHRSSRR